MRHPGTGIDWGRLSRQTLHDARARFGDLPELEDLVQDAFVLLLQREREIAKPRTWISNTVWRLLANHHRRHGPSNIPPSGNHSDSSEAVAELRLDLADAAQQLSPVERRILHLLVKGCTHREIANHLDIGWKSVGARVQRLRRKLRLLLELRSTPETTRERGASHSTARPR